MESRSASEIVASALKQRAWITTVESCTGGLVAHELTQVPGSSSIFWGGVVVYDESAKVKLLGVSPESIQTHGAISAEVAREMAMGGLSLLKTALRDRAVGPLLCISTTGIAGPGGGNDSMPVGLCWLGLATQLNQDVPPRCIALRIQAPSGTSRANNKAYFTKAALDMILNSLSSPPKI